MARYQIQSLDAAGARRGNTRNWRSESTDVFAQRDLNRAIASARVKEAQGPLVGRPVLVRIIRVGRWTGDFKEVVWESY